MFLLLPKIGREVKREEKGERRREGMKGRGEGEGGEGDLLILCCME
jgi:hypothetical protein